MEPENRYHVNIFDFQSLKRTFYGIQRDYGVKLEWVPLAKIQGDKKERYVPKWIPTTHGGRVSPCLDLYSLQKFTQTIFSTLEGRAP
jgi:hypothetical protein